MGTISLLSEKMATLQVPDSCDHEGDGDCVAKVKATRSDHGRNSDCIDFFMQVITKKTNIYSMKPVALKSPWTFWIDRTHNGMNVKEFEQQLHRIYTVYSVHEFWRVIYNIPLPSSLDCRSSMHFTREARRPVWEESYNAKGGTFRIRLAKRDTDKMWRELLMTTASERWSDYVHDFDDICGLSVSVRENEDVILIWNKDASLASTARVYECVHLLLPDTIFLGQFYKSHSSHHSFEGSLAPTAASSQEGITGVINHENTRGGGDRRSSGSSATSSLLYTS